MGLVMFHPHTVLLGIEDGIEPSERHFVPPYILRVINCSESIEIQLDHQPTEASFSSSSSMPSAA
jgi:hypothetical protein